MVTTKKVTKPAPRVIRGASRSIATRHRPHTLAPEHLGERASIATLAVGIGGVALLITSVAMIVSGLTLSSRYVGTPPPNIAGLGVPQVIGGAALLLLAMAISGAAAALLMDLRGARRTTIALAALTAALCAAGVVVVMTIGGGDRLLATALLVAAVTFGASSAILLRTGRPAPAA
ncbi:MAG TPA: hypothetical protein VFM19_00365 [Candidatus Limnocylindria bacterium]|nr:hypothetical protein [Candidatus Limnocylindria bacterium]